MRAFFQKSAVVGGLSGSLNALAWSSSSVMASTRAQSVLYLETELFEVAALLFRSRTSRRDDADFIVSTLTVDDDDHSIVDNAVEAVIDVFHDNVLEDAKRRAKRDAVFLHIAPLLVWIPGVAHQPYLHNVCTNQRRASRSSESSPSWRVAIRRHFGAAAGSV